MKKIKSENQILMMLAFFSISMGVWENFRQLWLQDNGFSATNISNIISIGTLISVMGIMFVGKNIIGILINYNVCLFISIIFLAISIIVMFNMSACRNIDSKQSENISIIKYILKSKLQVIYMIYSFIGAMAMSTALGLKYMFGLSAFFLIFQIGLAYYLIYLRKKEV